MDTEVTDQPSFAEREQYFRPSPVRAVFETAMRPDVISLAGGNPDLSFLPTEHIASLTQRSLASDGEDILQYGSGAGTDAARELSAALGTWGGATWDVDEIQMTSGSQAGLDAVTKLLCDPGDVIIAEGPTYVGVLGIFGAYQVRVRQIPLDERGLDPARVAAAIDEEHAAGRRVRYVYTISAYQNPAGISLDPSRHDELVEVCAKRGVWVVEDDAYGLLSFPTTTALHTAASSAALPNGAEPLPRAPMVAAGREDHVIHLGSYSKIFSPGLRLGWVAAPAAVRHRLQIACESVCITPAVLSQRLVSEYVGSEPWREALLAQAGAYQQRCEAAVSAAERYLPEGCRWHVPQGGFFLWVRLPEREWPDVLDLAISHRVVVIPGEGCYVDEEPGTHVRIAFSAISPEKIDAGMQRLGEALATVD